MPVKLALLALLAIGGWSAARRGDEFTIAALFGLASTATLLISPLSWAHHYMLWLPGLLLIPAWLWRAGQLRGAGFGHGSLRAGDRPLSVARLDGGAGLLGLGTTAWFLAAAVAMDRATRCAAAGERADSGSAIDSEAAARHAA